MRINKLVFEIILIITQMYADDSTCEIKQLVWNIMYCGFRLLQHIDNTHLHVTT